MVNDNHLTTIEHLPPFPSLKELNVRNNHIQTLRFSTLQELEDLDIRKNHITTIENIPSLPNIQRIRLGENPISSLRGMHRNMAFPIAAGFTMRELRETNINHTGQNKIIACSRSNNNDSEECASMFSYFNSVPSPSVSPRKRSRKKTSSPGINIIDKHEPNYPVVLPKTGVTPEYPVDRRRRRSRSHDIDDYFQQMLKYMQSKE